MSNENTLISCLRPVALDDGSGSGFAAWRQQPESSLATYPLPIHLLYYAGFLTCRAYQEGMISAEQYRESVLQMSDTLLLAAADNGRGQLAAHAGHDRPFPQSINTDAFSGKSLFAIFDRKASLWAACQGAVVASDELTASDSAPILVYCYNIGVGTSNL